MSVNSISKSLTTQKPLVVNFKNMGLYPLDLNGQIKHLETSGEKPTACVVAGPATHTSLLVMCLQLCQAIISNN